MPFSMTGMAVDDLGLGNYGGNLLGQQVAGETDEQRKKRLQMMQERSLIGPTGSPATLALFGGGMTTGGGLGGMRGSGR